MWSLSLRLGHLCKDHTHLCKFLNKRWIVLNNGWIVLNERCLKSHLPHSTQKNLSMYVSTWTCLMVIQTIFVSMPDLTKKCSSVGQLWSLCSPHDRSPLNRSQCNNRPLFINKISSWSGYHFYKYKVAIRSCELAYQLNCVYRSSN